MDLNETPRANRVHIAIFGKRNAGKSSLINALTGQEWAIVSEVKGTTTDPVYKSMELLPLGPVVIIDTPGLDDEGTLGIKRIEKAMNVLDKADIAILVISAEEYLEAVQKGELENAGDKWNFLLNLEQNLIEKIKEKKIPLVIVINKIDLVYSNDLFDLSKKEAQPLIIVSTKTGEGINQLKKIIAEQLPEETDIQIVGDLLQPADIVVLVVPIDKAAPKGRLILPQQQTIRDILEASAISIVTKENTLKEVLKGLTKKPKLVITDSQVFEKVLKETPEDIYLTSFSILFARYKGDLKELVKGVRKIEQLKDGDKILMAEGCTHHRQCDDIGTVKIPKWLMQYTGKKLIIESSSGAGFPKQLKQYALIVHCGSCMLNRKEMEYRLKKAEEENVPIINYGILIAYLKGILKRSVELFPEVVSLLNE